MNPEPDRLIAIAGAVAEEAPVSWEDEARLAGDEESAAIVRSLRDLEGIFAAQRRIERAYDTAAMKAPAPGADPRKWRHLIILDKIGAGSFGAVYRAYDGQLAVDVALKLLSHSEAAQTDPDRALKEARLLARVRHPNVVTVYGADQTENQVGVWMEFIKGQTLEQVLSTQGTFGAHEATVVGRDLCRAVAAVHQAGVLHGDIKARNVMRQEGGRTVLMDFGAGRVLIDDKAHRGPGITGTPMYLAPEVLAGRPQTISSDIYALGVLLYHLVTGSYPVSGESVADILNGHKNGQRRHLRDARPDLPDDFVRVVEQATAIDPARRFATAGALEDALVRLASSRPFESDGLLGRATQFFAPIPRWMMVLATVGVVAGVGATALWFTRAGSPQSTSQTTALTAVGSSTAAAYEIDAAFYRRAGNGEEKLAPGGSVAPGDELFLKLQASVPINLYVVNEDEKGEVFLLFPLPGQPLTNPIQAGQPVTLPGATRWQVTSAGGREHFLVFASPERLESFEQAFAGLPKPQENAPVVTARLEESDIDRLRGVGGLKAPALGGLTPDASRQGPATGLSRLFTTPLTNARENVRGLWIRQITLDNPGR